MLLTTKGRYAVMALVDMACYSAERPLTLQEVSQRQGIEIKYLEQIFAKLKKANLINSVKGPGGGYKLARKKDTILVSEIMFAVEENIKMTRCSEAEFIGCMHDKSRCITHDLWEELGNLIFNYLESISLADILNKKITNIFNKQKWVI